MIYLIDTCTLSELVKPKPEQRVVHWFDATPPQSLFVSVLTFGEIRRGVERLAAGRRRERIRAWLETELPEWFEDRVLPVDAAVAEAQPGPRTQPTVDALLAATARRHRLAIVTRNVADFAATGITVIDPWVAHGE